MRIPAALATSASRETAMRYLRTAQVDGFFAAAVCGGEVANTKPVPDVFCAAVVPPWSRCRPCWTAFKQERRRKEYV